MKLDVE